MNFLKILITFSLLFSACDRMVENKYTSADIKDDSVKKFMTPIEDEEESISKSNIQKPFISIPEDLKQEVSMSLNESLPLKSVLCETAKKLNINFQMASDINSKIIFQAKHRPFIEVLDAICDIANLRYTISNGVISVVKDTPFSYTYDLQFLNLSRDSENKISIATEVTSISGDNSDKSQNPSDSNVVVKAKSDFWSELDEALKIILRSNEKDNMKYSINKQSGIITVFANSKVQKEVRDYIEKVRISTMSQVLIEAKIIEVSLKNEYRRGINWGMLSGRFKLESSFGSDSSSVLNNVGSHGTPVSFSYSKNNMNTILNALEEFGSTRTISNPRITAMNNQAAVLKVAQNYVYFKLNYDKTYASSNTDRTDISVSTDIKTVPIGLVMFVQPSIDVTNNTVTLFLRPTITKLFDKVNDPAVDIAMRAASSDKTQYEQSKVPVTEVREVASVLKLNDGEIAVLGGFMESRSLKNKSGLPGIKDVPGVGELASSYGMGDGVVELVILIKVRLLNKNTNQKAADIRLQRFVPDPRPF